MFNSKKVKFSLQVHWMFVDSQKEDVSFHLYNFVSVTKFKLTSTFPTVPLEFLLKDSKQHSQEVMNSDDQNATEGNRKKHGMGKVIFVHLTDSSLDSTRSHVFCSKLQGWKTCDRRIYVIVYPQY